MISEYDLSIVTGAGSGIGKAATIRLLREGPVIAIGRSRERLDALSSEVGAVGLESESLDVGDAGAVEAFAARLSERGATVRALVNAAGFTAGGTTRTPLATLSETWDAVLSANLKGPFLMAMAIAPLLARPGGRIVNIGSIAAYTGGQRAGAAIYAASKSGLHGLTAGLARELSGEGITVNTIAPGLVAGTGFTGAWPEERIGGIVAETPAGRPGTPDEIAALIAFLCSPEAGFITGEIINQNGGWRFGS